MQTRSLEQELASNDALPSPFNDAQMRGLEADLTRAKMEYGDDGAELLAQTMAIIGRWSARAARKYASDRVEEVRSENEMLWRVVKDLSTRVESLEHLIELGGGSSGVRH
jgi:hypothetical protein